MLASFSIVPIGVGEELKGHVSTIVELIAKSGLPYKLGAMQTTVEGEADQIMELVMRCHRLMLESAPRVLTHIAIDDRKGATGRLDGKVDDVESMLGRDVSHE